MEAALALSAGAFFAGLLIGSFLNVCVFRLPRDLSVVRPARSFCPACEKTIAWYDNVPLLSYFLLRGKCRQCGWRIPLRYPVVELATGIAFAVCVAALGLTLPAFKYALLSAILIALIATDIEERILPDEFTLGGTLAGLALAAFVPIEPGIAWYLVQGSVGPRWSSLAESAFGAGISSGSIWLVGWIFLKLRHREGLGLGDVKMIAMIGAFLGLPEALLTLMAASLFGAVGGIIYILVTKKEMATFEIPFGSFLGGAALALAMWNHVVRIWLGH
jgi:leader peptidase (prepilin peptidase)/N-methyltransferase